MDLGEATHLIKTEPMAREDKELQAEARGRRLGASSQLHIVQLLMDGTIEEATYNQTAESRTKAGAASGFGQDRKRRLAASDEREQSNGQQAAMLNSLKLLRHEDAPQAQ